MGNVKKILSKLGSIVWGLIEVAIILYVVCITMCILCRNKYGYTQFDKYTLVTMQEETYKYVDKASEGDLLVVKSSKIIEEGDVIYYYTNIADQYVVKSGVVADMTLGETTSLYVLDDELHTTVASTKLLGKYASFYPTWGMVLDILMSRFGFLFLVLLPIMVVFIYQIYEFIMVLKYEKIEDNNTVKKKKVKLVEEKIINDDIELL